MDMDGYIDLSTAAKIVPTRPHAATIHRWARRGLRARNGERVRLRHVRIGGKIYTRREWLDELFEHLAAADAEHFDAAEVGHVIETPRPRTRTAAQRDKAIAAAEAELDRAGI